VPVGVVVRPKQPVLMVPEQTHDLGAGLAMKAKNRFHAPSRVGPSVDIVSEEHDSIPSGTLPKNLLENIVKGRKVPVNISDRNGGHLPGRYQTNGTSAFVCCM
jgi:hypothetical protein